MSNNITYIIIIFLNTFFCFKVECNNIKYFETISIEHNLSHTVVNCITQDKNGFLWFGTENGLNRFDGYDFKVFKTNPNDSLSLHSNSIKALLTDSNGNIWIGTSNGGLHIYNPDNEEMLNLLNKIPKKEIYCLIEDSDSNIWVGSYGNGISIINNNTLESIDFEHNNLLPSQDIRCLYLDRKNNLWIGTDGGGAVKYSLSEDKLTFFKPENNSNSIAGASIMSIVETNNRYIWFATYGNGVTRYDTKTEEYRTFSKETGELSHNIIWRIYKENENELWFASRGGGIDMFDLEKEIVENVSNNNLNTNDEISTNFILDILKDNSGLYWIATERKGVCKLDFNKIKFYSDKYLDVKNYNVTSIATDSIGNIWYGTSGNGVVFFNKEFNTYENLFFNDNQHLSSDYILSIKYDNRGYLWIGTDGAGVDRYDIENKSIINYSETSEYRLSNNAVHKILIDSNGNVWIGTYGGGLNRINKETGSIDVFELSNIRLQNVVRDIFEDALGNIWIATPHLGLGLVDKDNMSIKFYQNKIFDSSSISSNIITTIIQAKNSSELWIGTGGSGLCKMDIMTEKFVNYTSVNGLTNDIVVAIIPFDDDLWIGTLNGLSKLCTQNYTFNNFNKGDGLKSNTINTLAIEKTRNGKIIIGTEQGVNHFFPKSTFVSDYIPPIVISDLKLDNKSVFVSDFYCPDIIDTTSNNTYYFKFSHNYNLISFHFAALDFVNPNNIKYKYILENVDSDWVEINSSQRTISYSKLPYGDYILRIKASNSNGVWGENEKIIHITITPPFWKTKWFIVLVILIFLGIAYYIIRLKTKKLIIYNSILERKVEERTKLIQNRNEEIILQSDKINLQRKELEIKNQELEKLTIATRETENAIAILNINGIVEWCNYSFSKIFVDNNENNILAKHLLFSNLKNNNSISEYINQCIQQQKTIVFISENINQKKWIQTSLTPIFNSNNEVERIVAIDTDITELKKAEAEILIQNNKIQEQNKELEEHRLSLETIVQERTGKLQEALSRAKESDRLKTSFLTNLSHEIRTPMNAIVGFADLLSLPSISQEKKKKFAQLINKNSDSLIRLIDDIIDLSKLETGQIVFEKSEFKVYNSMLRIFLSQKEKIEALSKDIELLHTTSKDLSDIVLYSDVYRLEQVVVNLIDNAIKYTDKGEISYWFEKFTGQQGNEFLKFNVKDTGIGIKHELQNSIFKSFAKIEENKVRLYRGTGLGLSISKNIISLLGGQIGVSSEPEVGSHFFFTIPLEDCKDKFDRNTIDWEGKTILVAEDEDINFMLINEALKFTKAKIRRAYDGEEVLNIWKETKPDVILMDIKMPNYDGVSATKIIRLQDKATPIIAQTAFALLSEKEKIIGNGFNDLITKPISHNTLINILNKYLGNNGKRKG